VSISTFNGLNVALRGLLTQQRALDVTSHNIANANTEGYTRQEAVLNSEEPLANVGIWGMIFPGQMGQGVTVDSYRRIRDVFNDTELRGQLARQAGAEVRYRELSGIETAIPEPGDNGIQALMTKFFANWQDVANNPENLAARQALAQQAQDVHFVGRLATYRYYNMDQVVGQALATFRRIAEREGRATLAAQAAGRAIAAN